jgi:opacity protein-like surface antigen
MSLIQPWWIFMKRMVLSVATLAALMAASAPAAAADPVPMVPSATNTWGGFYLGGHAGCAFAISDWTSDIGMPAGGTVALPSSEWLSLKIYLLMPEINIECGS